MDEQAEKKDKWKKILFLEAIEKYDDDSIKNLATIIKKSGCELVILSSGWNIEKIPETRRCIVESGHGISVVDECAGDKGCSASDAIKRYLSDNQDLGRYVIASTNEKMLAYFPGRTVYCKNGRISDLNRRQIERIFQKGYWWRHSSLWRAEPCDDGYRQVVFLDIDGVLNDDDKGPKVDKKMVLNLAHIIRGASTGEEAEIVLTSSWRYGLARWAEYDDFSDKDKHNEYASLIEELSGLGLSITDMVPMMDSGPDSRPTEIRTWLEHHLGVENYLILDDESFWTWDEDERRHVVTTAFCEECYGYDRHYYGLYERYIYAAMQVLKGDESSVLLKLRLNKANFVDKSRFIKDWWETASFSYVITRPYASGKSVNMRMLNCFFSNRYAQDGEKIFGGLEIWKDEKYRALQGKYPTVFLDFSDVRCSTYEQTKDKIFKKVQKLFIEYGIQIDIDKVPYYLKKDFENYQKGIFQTDSLSTTVMDLVRILYQVYGRKVLMILDGYDVPEVYAYLNGYTRGIEGLLYSFFISCFKENQNKIERAIMCGSTGLTVMDLNCSFNPAWDERFTDDFGFTDAEVNQLINSDKMAARWDKKDEIKEWYRSYSCCDDKTELYSPASILLYLYRHDSRQYWMSDTTDDLIEDCMKKSDSCRQQISDLAEHGTPIYIDSKLVNQFCLEREFFTPWDLPALMYNAGYLAARELPETPGEVPIFELYIPNEETRQAINALLEKTEKAE